MRRWQCAAPLVVLAASAPFGTQAGRGLEVSAVRFYRAAGEQTLVEAFCRVPFALLSPLDAAARQAAYRFSVTVRDSAGLELLSQSWSQGVPADLARRPGASTVERFRFAARPGRYAVSVAVQDSGSGRVMRREAEIRTFGAAPGASDLLLASAIREAAGPGDTVARDGEIRKGALFLQSSGQPVLTPQQGELGYYLELYAAQAESATVTVRVRGSGAEVIATAPQAISVGAGGGGTRGMLDLAGLPPGEYRLEVVVATPESALVRDAAFGMAGFETEAAIAPLAAPRAGDRFAGLREAELDSLYGPLIYLMTGEEQGIYSGLTVEGKRQFLRRFWAGRDPTPDTPENEAFRTFYAAVREANRRFHEGGAAQIPGWRTDRGRILIRYGGPDEVLNRPQAGGTRPYEVWKYTRARARKFVFLDATAFGHYELIWTNERRESSRPDWQNLLGREAVEDVERF